MNIDRDAKEYRPIQTTAREFQFVAVGDLEYREAEYIVEELFETDTLGLMFGDPSCGKSFLAADIPLSVRIGIDFPRRETKQGTAFFIAG
ncbi:hypothetical protein [uncultured Sulfitobacter sp.]|uniref:hypothetical protein n=1 Tax=uncultured Sulfitobacter sp. TaxID=191468 RepID=UPI00261C9AA9|nr:hypothetical protein [uncultured Sulfitobacter sp.]